MNETSSLYNYCSDYGNMISADVNLNTYINFEFQNNEKDT